MTYSTEQQAQIIKMKSEGRGSREIAKSLGLSKSGVNDWYNRETGTDANVPCFGVYGGEGGLPLFSEVKPPNHKDDFRWNGEGFAGLKFNPQDSVGEIKSMVNDYCTMGDECEDNSTTGQKAVLILPPQYMSSDASEAQKKVCEASIKFMETNWGGHEDNSVILFISDMHIPYHHKNLIPFLKGLKDKYKPTRVICLGDELDLHSLSFHDSDPDLMSAGDELKEAMKVIKQVEELFPVMDLVDSNHGSLAYRKAKHHGIPQHFIKGYNEVLEVGDGWKWHHDLIVKLPNGEDVYVCHGKAARGVQLSQNMGMSVVQGHHHSEFNIHYWANPKHLHFSVQCGSLIDDKSLAMAYNKLTLKRPIIGTALIVNGIPMLEAMPL